MISHDDRGLGMVQDGDLLIGEEVYCPTTGEDCIADVSADAEGWRWDCPSCGGFHEFGPEERAW